MPPDLIAMAAETHVDDRDIDLLALALRSMTKQEVIAYAYEQGFKADNKLKKDELIAACLEQNFVLDIDALPSNGIVAIAEEMKYETDGKTLAELRDLIAGE